MFSRHAGYFQTRCCTYRDSLGVHVDNQAVPEVERVHIGKRVRAFVRETAVGVGRGDDRNITGQLVFDEPVEVVFMIM